MSAADSLPDGFVARSGVDFFGAGSGFSRFEKALCQERKSDFIPLDNIYTYPLYSEGFSLCGRARPASLEGNKESALW